MTDATTPVAWRWRWKDLPDAGWQLSSVGGWRRDTEHIEAQPLYLHPPHQPKRTVTYVCPVCAASLEPKADSDREQAENATLQAAWRIADEASRELIEVHGMRVDHVTISFDADEIASTPALEDAIEYLENRGLATRMDAPDEVLVIMNEDDA